MNHPMRLALPIFVAGALVLVLAVWASPPARLTPQAQIRPTEALPSQAPATAVAAPAVPTATRAVQDLTRRDKGEGSVTVVATLLTTPAKEFDPASEIAFEIALDTHAVELGAYDLAKAIVLRDGAGAEHRAIRWTGGAGGGHHRSGLIVFTKNLVWDPAADGKETLSLELVVKDVSGVRERVLRWDDAAGSES